MRRIAIGLGAILLIALLLFGMPALLIAIGPIGLPHIEPSFAGIWRALLRPDDGTLALTLIKTAAWITWAILAGTIILEAFSALRHIRAPQLRGFALPQGLARGLVAASIAVFINIHGALAQPTDAGAQPTPPAAAPANLPEHQSPAEQRGDTKGSYDRYTVKKGDILSQLSLDQLGDARRYPEIYRASRSIHQPGGQRLTDPDVIDIGWKLNIPNDKPRADPKPVTGGPEKTPQSSTNRLPATPAPAQPTAASRPTSDTAAATASQSEAASDENNAEAQPAWLLSGLAGAGAILAGSLWLALRRRRTTQHHHRRPGFMTAPPPPATLAVEKTLRHEGQPIADLLGFVDETLRRFAAAVTMQGQPLPSLVGVEVARSSLTLHLAAETALTAPWKPGASQTRWSITTSDDTDEIGPLAPDGPAPWPHLATIGADDTGHWWLLNLEHLGTATITGNPEFADDLARYLAAELATNPWSRDLELDLVGVFGELTGLDPARVHFHPEAVGIDNTLAAAVDTIDRLNLTMATDAPTARATQVGDDLWASHVLITKAQPQGNLDRLVELIQTMPGRTAAAAVIIGAGRTDGRSIELAAGSDGRVRIPDLGLDLIANGITIEEARGSVALLQAADNLDGAPVPAASAEGEPWRQLCDQAGKIAAELTTPRDPSGSQGATSVLPDSDETILITAATTAEDLAELAPSIPAKTIQRIADADSTLDADLADWFSDHCDRPRIAVLGSMRVRGGRGGDASEANRRKPFYTEIVAYLATKLNGATMEEMCAAFASTPDLIRRRLAVIRKWLGTDPRTGQLYLPVAARSEASTQRGSSAYQLTNVLYDADLFRRLRLRGQSRGPAGLHDFLQALSLVRGTPHSDLRPRGGIWLADNREDQHLLVAIVDVAHLAATMAIQAHDFEAARRAVRTAMNAAPDEEMPKLDLAAIAAAEGDRAESERVARDVCDQQDAEGPLDLDPRTRQLLLASGWVAPRSRVG